ncbi:hypothetical protein HN51_027245, partial [Arachis hypogaea]
MHGTYAVASFLFNSKSNITANPNTTTKENSMAENTAARFMCSFGGQIRHHDGSGSNNHQHFFYYGGNNRILEVDRNISFHDLTAELSALCGGAAINFFKYLIPGDDLDTLVTVTNDRDLGYMMREYDLHFRGSASADRMRIFLFFDPVHNGVGVHNNGVGVGGIDGRAWEPRKRFLPLLRTKIQELAEV